MPDNIMSKSTRFLLVYGSATGQAQAIAEEIAEKALSFGLFAELHCLDETGKKFDIEKEKCVVIITSTTGDGDPPDNAGKFVRRLRKRTLSRDHLAHLHYALLGLGDSNYSNFCRCPRDLDSRLEELGAHRFYPTGLADDGVGLEVVVEPWLAGLFPALQQFLGVTGPSMMTLTETVQSLQLTESDIHQFMPNQEQSQSTNGAVQSSDGPSQSADVALQCTLVNGDIHLAGASINEDKVTSLNIGLEAIENVESNTTSVGSVVLKAAALNSGTSITNSDKIVHNSVADNSLPNPAIQVANVIESFLKTATSMKLNTLNECIPDPESSLSLTDSAEVIASSCSLGIPPPAVLDKVAGGIGRSAGRETPCVATVLHDPPSFSLALACSQPPLSEQSLTIPVLPPAYLRATFGGEPIQISTLTYQNGCKLPCSASEVFKVQIMSAQVLTAPDAVKKTLLLRLNIEGYNLQYSPGDSISVICPNNSSEVDLLLQRLGQTPKADDTMTLAVIPDTKKRRAAIPPHVHPVSTLQHVLTTCLNIREPPSKAFIRALLEHTSDGHEVRRMQELCSKEGSQEYSHWIREANVSLLDFLFAFPSCNPSVEILIEFNIDLNLTTEHLPRLQPRPYSVCSCQEVSPTSIDIVFNVVEVAADASHGHLYQRRGVCTGWLDDITGSIQAGNQENFVEIPIFLRTNQHFRPPEDLSKPLIMIGPGTGVAPFIGFLHQRGVRRQLLKDNEIYGMTWLFFGCRNQSKDYLFREELHQLEASGTLSRLSVAFSRDQLTSDTASTSPRYVQDLLRSAGEEIADLLTESEALVYVCGDAKNMAKDVSGAFEDILKTVKGISPDEAHMFMMKKRIHKTYFEDVWV